MTKKIALFIFPLLFLFGGCIDIVEELTINPDKSGNVSIYVDLGTLGGFAMNLGESYMEGTMLEQIRKMPETAAELLKNVEGISNIKPVTNKKGMYALSFGFKNAKQLNAAIYKMFDLKKKFFAPNYIRITKNKLVKKNYAPLLGLVISKYKDKIKQTSALDYISYKSIIHLPKTVKRFSNRQATLLSDKKTLTYTCPITELLTSNVNVGNKIKY